MSIPRTPSPLSIEASPSAVLLDGDEGLGLVDDDHSVSSNFSAEEASISFDEIGVGKYQWILLLKCGIAHAADAVEIVAVSFIIPAVTELELTPTQKGSLGSAIFIGMLFGSWIWGALADQRGRPTIAAYALMLNAMFGIFSAFSTEYWHMLLLRLVSGFGAGGSIPIVFAYFSEFYSEATRKYYLVLLAAFWTVGMVFTSAVALGMLRHDMFNFFGSEIRSWRIFLIVCAAPSALSAVMLFFSDRSPLWLVTKRKYAEASRVVNRICELNGRPAPSGTMEELASLASGSDRDGSNRAPILHTRNGSNGLGSSNSETPNEKFDQENQREYETVSKIRSLNDDSQERELAIREITSRDTSVLLTRASSDDVVDEVTTTSQRHRCSDRCGGVTEILQTVAKVYSPSSGLLTMSIYMNLVWFLLSFGAYGLLEWMPEYFNEIDAITDLYMSTFITSVASIPGQILSIVVVRFMSAKTALYLSLFVTGVSVFLLAVVSGATDVLVAASVFNCVSLVCWNMLNIVTATQYPTEIKSTAYGVNGVFGRLGAIVGNVLFGVFVSFSVFYPLVSVAVVLFGAAFFTVLLPRRTYVQSENV